MEITSRHIGGCDYSAIIEVTIIAHSATITEAVTGLNSKVSLDFIHNLRQLADELEEHNYKVIATELERKNIDEEALKQNMSVFTINHKADE